MWISLVNWHLNVEISVVTIFRELNFWDDKFSLVRLAHCNYCCWFLVCTNVVGLLAHENYSPTKISAFMVNGQEHLFSYNLAVNRAWIQPSEQTNMYANSLQCTVQITLLLPYSNLFHSSRAVLYGYFFQCILQVVINDTIYIYIYI